MRVLDLVFSSVMSVILLDEISIIFGRSDASSNEIKGTSLTSVPVKVTFSFDVVFGMSLRLLGLMRNSSGVSPIPVSLC